MLRILLAGTAAIFMFSMARAADCPLADIEKVLNAPLDGMKPIEKEVSDVQSTEGGGWQIYKDKKGRVHSIIRNDYGESGRGEIRLSILDRKAYGIARTRYDYIRHAFLEGPFAIAKKSTDYYFFCDGKVYLPAADAAMVDLDRYPKDAAEAQTATVGSPDVAEFTKGLAK
ncbi:MAG: hypothetical protein AB7F76_11835 [Parvibaculaceae bacterium]|jgi:hypothetical protein